MVADALDGMKRLRWTVLGPAWRPIVVASTMVLLAVALLVGFLLLRPSPIASGPQGVRDDVDASADLSTFTTIGVDTPFGLPLRPRPTRTREPAAGPADRDLPPRRGGAGGAGDHSGQGSSGSDSGSGSGPGTSTGGGANPGPVTVTPPTTAVDPIVTDPQPDPVKPGKDPTNDQGQGPPDGVPPAEVPPVSVPPVQVGPIADSTVSVDGSSAALEIGTTSVTVGSNGILVG